METAIETSTKSEVLLFRRNLGIGRKKDLAVAAPQSRVLRHVPENKDGMREVGVR